MYCTPGLLGEYFVPVYVDVDQSGLGERELPVQAWAFSPLAVIG